jgi:hypothetical protein
VAALVASAAFQGTGLQGWSQRMVAVLVPLGIVALALRTRRLAIADAKAESGRMAGETS